MKSKILLLAFVYSSIFLLCGVKKENVDGSLVEMNPGNYDTDLEKVEQEFNAIFRKGRRVYNSAIHIDENSRINYATITIDDSTKVYSENNQIRADVPLTAKVSHVKWKTAFGKKYTRDTLLKDVKIALKLETELKINQEEKLNAETNAQVEMLYQLDFLKHLKDIEIFEKEGKLATSFQRITLRNSEVKK